jgi:hypothetical protein
MATQSKVNKTIVLNISEKKYPEFIKDSKFAHEIIISALNSSPELFPEKTLEQGYSLKGLDRISKKMNIRLRRIKIGDTIFRIRPSFLLPYMTGKTEEIKGPLFLIRFGVPFWAIALVFGRNSMYWYRMFIRLSFFNLISTTVYDKTKMPLHILADEFHIRIRKVKSYVATVVGGNCFLGAEASWQANEEKLKEAYGVFKKEACSLVADYQPLTINTDGWAATQNALKSLFVNTIIIECFLHAVIKIRDRATKKLQEYYADVADKVWSIYESESKRHMGQQIRRLREWTIKNVPKSAMKDNILKLCKKKVKWLLHFNYLDAYRTSAHLDRTMKIMERHSINSQMFHSNLSSTSKNFRALALLYNFSPSCPAVTKEHPKLTSPTARLNGFVYSTCWLQNLMIAASLNGFKS